MDLPELQAFLESQETAIKAILTSCTDKIDSEDIRKAIDTHIARTSRIVRNALPPTPNPAGLSIDSPIPNRSSSSPRKLAPVKTTTKSPLKPGQVLTGVSNLFNAGSRGSGSNARKRAISSSDDDSTYSPPKSSISSSKKRNTLQGARQSEAPKSSITSPRRGIPPPPSLDYMAGARMEATPYRYIASRKAPTAVDGDAALARAYR